MPKKTKRGKTKKSSISRPLIDDSPLLLSDAEDPFADLGDYIEAEEKSRPKPLKKKPLAQIQTILVEEKYPVNVLRISRKTNKRIRDTALLLTLISFLYDTSSIVLSLRDMDEMSDDTLTKMLGLSVDHMIYVAPASYAIPSMYLYYHGMIYGFKTALSVRYSPVQLNFHSPLMGMDMCMCCDRLRTYFAVSAIAAIVFISAAEDGADGDYFFMNLVSNPKMLWKIISVILSVPFALSTFLTETPGLFHFFCSNSNELYPILVEGERYFPPAPEPINPLTNYQQTIVNGIGNLLRIGGGIELAIEIYVVLAALFNPNDFTARITLFGLCILRPITSFFFYGEKGMDSVNDFSKAIARKPSLRQAAIFILSVVFDIFAIDCIRELYRNFLTNPSTDMPFDLADWLVELFADSTAIFEGVVLLGATYMIISMGVDKLFCNVVEPEAPEQRIIETNEEQAIEPTEEEEEKEKIIELSDSSQSKYRPPVPKEEEIIIHHNASEDLLNDDSEPAEIFTFNPRLKPTQGESIIDIDALMQDKIENSDNTENSVITYQPLSDRSTAIASHRNIFFHHAQNGQANATEPKERRCVIM